MTTARRNVAEARRITLLAVPADLAHAAHALSRFADERAGDGPVRDPQARDFATEVLEELADARNYLVWWFEYHRLPPACSWAILEALGAVTAAFHHANTAVEEATRCPS